MLHGPLVIDAANPVNRSHPFAPDAWWLATPSRRGGSKWFDMMSPQDTTLGHHATLTNMGSSATTGWQVGSPSMPGHFGALSFDASNDYAEVGNHQWFTTTAEMTWIVDFYPKSLTGFPGLVGKGNSDSSTSGSFLIFCSGGNTAGFVIYRGGSRLSLSTTGLTTNTWWQFAATSSPGNRISIHLNGIFKNSQSWSGGTVLDEPGFSLLFGTNEGASSNKSAYPFNGLISSIRYYRRTFADQAMKEIYYHSLAGYPGLLRNAFGMYRITNDTGWGALLGEYRNRLVIS